MKEMFHVFEFIWAYTNDLLIITKGGWSNKLEILLLTLQELKNNALKFNIENSFFEQTDMEYLGS